MCLFMYVFMCVCFPVCLDICVSQVASTFYVRVESKRMVPAEGGRKGGREGTARKRKERKLGREERDKLHHEAERKGRKEGRERSYSM